MLVVMETHPAECLAHLSKQRDEGLLCDIELVVEEKRFSAHRNVLAANSDYFATMFRTNMKEKFSHSVELKEISYEIMELVLNFMYLGQIDVTMDNVIDILQAASMMQIKGLLKTVECCYLMGMIESNNALEMREISKKYYLEMLQEKTENCIFENFEEVCMCDKFLDVSAEDLEYYMCSDKVMVELEDILFTILVSWTNHKLDERKVFFPQLFRHIRLQYVSVGFLSNTIRKELLVKKNTKCRDLIEDAMHYYIQPDLFEKELPRAGTYSQRWYLLTPRHKIISLQLTVMTCRHEVKQPEFHVDYHSAIALQGDKVFFFGGYKSASSNIPTRSIVTFDGELWKHEGNMQFPRADAVAIAFEGILFIFGGRAQQSFENRTEMFVNGNCVLDQHKNQQQNRSSACAVIVKDFLFLIGGCCQIQGQGFQQTRLMQSSVECVNLKSNERKRGPPLNQKRGDFAAHAIDKTIYVFGGIGDGNQALSSAELLATEVNCVWTMLSPTPVPLSYASCCLVSKFEIVVLGRECDQLYCFYTPLSTWKNKTRKKRKYLQSTGDSPLQAQHEQLCLAEGGSKIFGFRHRLFTQA